MRMPQIPVIHNVSVSRAGSVEETQDLLKRQLYSPVRWVETVQAMAGEGVRSLVEAGPGKVLTGLSKRIDKSLTGLAVFDPPSLDKALETLNG
jgi:[acyl-carrier-protein] S-malonyltransferase